MPNKDDSPHPTPDVTCTVDEDEYRAANTGIARLMYRLRHIVMLCKSVLILGPSTTLAIWKMQRRARKLKSVTGMWLVGVRRNRRGEKLD